MTHPRKKVPRNGHRSEPKPLLQGDSDVSTPLPFTTNTNPLVTQVTFEDERRRMTAPMEIDDTFDDSVADNGNSNRVMAASVGTTHMKL